ncbi:APC amino acid permease [Suillus clintonianus]|uniref:APC amino acid permease n=1 Tax=Suillus clintonianus TaxID=1904413 RepID=UPI001B86A0B2|nr:APC amino acid permease [Suillus clintonianus]KAG2118394.1 APC amino acid permease [Suillus clintonianus]
MDGPSETEPLLRPAQDQRKVTNDIPAEVYSSVQDEPNRNVFDDVPDAKRQIGLASAVMLIFNRVIGAGVFAAPSVILRSSGSVGMTFVMWILGALVASAGTAVYVEFGTGLPRSGGEKTYMEYIYRRPRFMITCFYATYGLLISRISAGSLVVGEYTLNALAIQPTIVNVRVVAFLCSTFCLIAHGAFLNSGLKIQNALCLFKFFVLLTIALSGLFSLAGVPGFVVRDGYDIPHNFTWSSFWEGSDIGLNAFVMGMYNVIWSYAGYSNANYVLSEVRDPIRTIKRAAPLAMLLVAVSYLFVNVAYFAVVSKQDMLEGGTMAAALFFRNLFGPATERILSAAIALSVLGNLMSMLFAQGRIVQELGREGVLPLSSFFASNKPFNAPLAGLFTHWLVTMITMVAAPPGEAYLFIVNFASYPLTMFNILISGGLLLLYTPAFKSYHWRPPFRAWKSIVVFFFLSNVFLAIVPMIPPSPGSDVYEHLPYWSHIAMALSIGLLGIIYWFVFFNWIPRKRGYRIVQETVLQDDGVSRNVLRRIPNGSGDEGSA